MGGIYVKKREQEEDTQQEGLRRALSDKYVKRLFSMFFILGIQHELIGNKFSHFRRNVILLKKNQNVAAVFNTSFVINQICYLEKWIQ